MSKAGRFLLALLLAALAAGLRWRFLPPFLALSTHDWVNLLVGANGPWLALVKLGGGELGRLLVAVIVPDLLLLAALGLLPGSRALRLSFIALALAALVTLLALRWGALHAHTWCGDEYAYVFQSQVLATGRHAAPAPPMAEFFKTNLLTMHEGRWFACVPPGWPALLALGQRLGAGDLTAPLVGWAAFLAALLLAGQLFEASSAAWAGLLLLFSPGLILNAASNFSHQAQLLWSCLAGALLIASLREPGSLWRPLASGLAMGMATCTRFVDAALWTAALLVYLRLARARPSRSLLLLPLGWGLVTLYLLASQAEQTGSPWTPNYTLVGLDASLLAMPWSQRILNLLVAFTRSVAWQPPLWLPLVLWSLRRGTPAAGLALALTALFGAAYSVGTGQSEIAARYYLGPLVLLTFLGGHELARRQPGALLVSVWALVALVNFAQAGLACSAVYGPSASVENWLLKATGARPLVFTRTLPFSYGPAFVRNRPDLSGRVMALFLDPRRCEALRAQMGDRPAYVLDFLRPAGNYQVQPFEQPRNADEDWLLAGGHYASGLGRFEEALAMWDQIPSSSQVFPSALLNSAQALLRLERNQAAGRVAEELTRLQPQLGDGYFLWGQALAAEGRTGEAARAFHKAAELLPPGHPNQLRARLWVQSQ